MILAIFTSLITGLTPEAQANTTFGPIVSGNLRWWVEIPTGSTAGTLTIESSSGSNVQMANFTRGAAPWSAHSTQVDCIVIRNNVTTIGNFAFADFTRVRQVVIPGDITRIGNDAFRECANLLGFRDNMPSNPDSWSERVFTALTEIGSGVFFNCYSLGSLRMPVINTIGTEAFTGCRGLINIDAGNSGSGSIRTMPDGVVVGMNSANPRQAVRIIKAPVNLADRIGSTIYYVPDSFSSGVNTITTIEIEAFAYVRNLTEVVIPACVTTIRDRAFAYIGTPGAPSSLTTASFMGDAPTAANFGKDVFLGITDELFEIVYFPHGLRWTSPRWNGYRTRVDNSRITLDRYVIVMEVGNETELRATVHPSTANQAVVWGFGDSVPISVVDINGKSHPYDNVALIKAKVPGMTTVRAVTFDMRAWVECTVIVLDSTQSATSVILDRSQLTVSIGAATAPSLTAIVHPYPSGDTAADQAERERIARELVWASSDPTVAVIDPGSPTSLTRSLILRKAGTTTITVTTRDGLSSARCVVTVTAMPVFVPVTSVTLGITSVAMGTDIYLGDHTTVLPANATFHTPSGIPGDFKTITWRVVPELTTVDVKKDAQGCLPDGMLSVPWGKTGVVVVDAEVDRGRADKDWGFSRDEPFIQRFTITVAAFIPVTHITGVPSIAFVGRPLQITGTVNPANASYKEIKWEMTATDTGAMFDPVSRMLTAQWPGTVTMRATVQNGRIDADGSTPLVFTQNFTIVVEPYITNTLTLNANPGGSISPWGLTQAAGGEVIQLTATPSRGYIFAGWNSTNGGQFADSSNAVTQFTMPRNATTVTAYFTYIGLPGGGAGGDSGGVVLPNPVHYFTNSSIYMRNSGVSFGHVTIRDFQFFSHVTLNGRTLTQNSHYTASRSGGFTQIILANGYLDALAQGAHTLMVHFTDYVTVTAVFTVLWGSQVSQSYTDVFSSDWYYHSVEYVSYRGWMFARSSEPGRFRPSDPATQGEVIDAIYCMAGSPTILNANNQVLQGRDAALEWVRANAILPIGGYFNLNSAITRQDLTVLFGRLVSVLRLRYPVVRGAPAFADDWQIDQVARSHVIDMYRAGIINGRTASTFVPMGTLSRAEFATFLRQFAEAIGHWA